MTSLRLIPTHRRADLVVGSDLEVRHDLVLAPEPEQMPAATRYVMALLADGVPLSLLCDLADPAGPPSADMASSETGGAPVLSDLLAFRAEQRTLLLG